MENPCTLSDFGDVCILNTLKQREKNPYFGKVFLSHVYALLKLDTALMSLRATSMLFKYGTILE